jgi:hypothetical protein
VFGVVRPFLAEFGAISVRFGTGRGISRCRRRRGAADQVGDGSAVARRRTGGRSLGRLHLARSVRPPLRLEKIDSSGPVFVSASKFNQDVGLWRYLYYRIVFRVHKILVR